METTYQVIKRIENNMDFTTLLQKGLIPLTVLDKKVYYEYYMKQMKITSEKWQSISNTSEEFCVSEMTIRRAIKFMEQ